MNGSVETTAFDETTSSYGTASSGASAVTWSAGTTFSGSTTTAVTGTTSNFSEATTHIFDTYSVFVHPHWRNFPLVSDHWHYLIGFCITMVGFTGITGNSLVILMFTREKSLRTSSNMLIVNLAISDLTFCVVNGFPLFSLSAFNKRWIFGQAACEFYGLIGGIFGLMSINTMATIAIDRYYAIARPLNVAKSMTRRRAFLMIVVVWLWSLVSAAPPVFGWGRYIPEGFQTSCTFDYLTRTDNNRSYIFFLYIFGFVAPLAIIFTCYALIIRAVKLHENEMKKMAKKLNAEMRTNQDKKNMEIKVAKIAMSILVLYLLSWTPYATVALIGQFGNASFVTPFWSEIPVLFAKASAMHNPLVYALSHPKFRGALQKRFPWLTCCCTPVAKSPAPSGTYTERNASKRSVSSVAGATSISSEMSYIDEATHNDMEFRLRKLEEEQENKKVKKSSLRKRDIKDKITGQEADIPAGKIIQDLIHALVEVSSRKSQTDKAAQPVNLPGNTLEGKASDRGAAKDEVFVFDKNTLPELANYLAKYSNLNDESTAGVDNKGIEMSPKTPRPEDVGARPKTNISNDNDEDEAQL